MRAPVFMALLCCLMAQPAIADSACGSFAVPVGPSRINLAPPSGFVEVCGRDSPLCTRLTAGYPKTAKTIGYFVNPQEWDQYRGGHFSGFSHYLIAQLANGVLPAEFSDLRRFIRSQQGDIPDHTQLPANVDSEEKANIGVFEDSADAIAFGVVMKVRPAASAPITLASANAAFLAKDHVLSLYVFVDVTAQPSGEPAKRLTRQWLACLRRAM